MDFVQTHMGVGVYASLIYSWRFPLTVVNEKVALSLIFLFGSQSKSDCDANRHIHVCKYKSISEKLIYHVRTNFSSSNYLKFLAIIYNS
jgi:hypothetical protein